MINYIILGGILLAVFAIIQLAQNIYVMKLADDKNTESIKRTALIGIIISSTMIAVGLLIIGISVFAHLQVEKPPPHPEITVIPPSTVDVAPPVRPAAKKVVQAVKPGQPAVLPAAKKVVRPAAKTVVQPAAKPGQPAPRPVFRPPLKTTVRHPTDPDPFG